MTTVKNLFVEELYLKGEPILGLGGSTTTNISNVANTVNNLNAIFSGLTGGEPPALTNQPLGIQTRVPNTNDDVNEGWKVGAVWVYGSQAWVCVDNSELAAFWIPVMLQINDGIVSAQATYSSIKINTILLAASNALTAHINNKADIVNTYTKLEVNAALNTIFGDLWLKANITDLNSKVDQSDMYLKADQTDLDDLETNVLNMLQEFPIEPIIGGIFATTALTYTSNGINVSGSSLLPNYTTSIAPHMAFNQVYGTEMGWLSNNAFYGSGYTTFLVGDVLSVQQSNNTFLNYNLYRTNVDGVNVGKQWLQIDCGVAKSFEGFKINFKSISSTNLKSYSIAGSNDGTNFTELYSNTNETNTTSITRSLLYTTPYRYYRIVVNDIQNSNGVNNFCSVQEWSLLQKTNVSDFVSTTELTTAVNAIPNVEPELNKLIALLNSWIISGNLNLSALAYASDPIREHW